MKIVLASASPRRREILERMKIEHIVDVSNVSEDYVGMPDDTVKELSLRKAKAVAQNHPDSIIIAADTLVYLNKTFGKPNSVDAAKKMLQALSGKWHDVYTGVTVMNTQTGAILSEAECTKVHFIELAEHEIDTYIATGEPLDKAGAYGIQGMGEVFIDRIEGSYSNVVGLPMALLYQMLKKV